MTSRRGEAKIASNLTYLWVTFEMTYAWLACETSVRQWSALNVGRIRAADPAVSRKAKSLCLPVWRWASSEW